MRGAFTEKCCSRPTASRSELPKPGRHLKSLINRLNGRIVFIYRYTQPNTSWEEANVQLFLLPTKTQHWYFVFMKAKFFRANPPFIELSQKPLLFQSLLKFCSWKTRISFDFFFNACDVKDPCFRYKVHECWEKMNTIVSPTALFIHMSPALRLAPFGTALIFP